MVLCHQDETAPTTARRKFVRNTQFCKKIAQRIILEKSMFSLHNYYFPSHCTFKLSMFLLLRNCTECTISQCDVTYIKFSTECSYYSCKDLPQPPINQTSIVLESVFGTLSVCTFLVGLAYSVWKFKNIDIPVSNYFIFQAHFYNF